MIELGVIIPSGIFVLTVSYTAGYYVSKIKNGRSNKRLDTSRFTSRELCEERHKGIDEKLASIQQQVNLIPDIKAWIDMQRGK